jgi:hypothetical protein
MIKMKINNKPLVISIIIILIFLLFPGCIDLEGDNEGSHGGNNYFSESYNKIPYILTIEQKPSNNSSYIIIPAPIQNNKILELSEFQNNSEFNNFSYKFVDTEYGKGLQITPIPTGNFWLWFDCESYTVKGPFDIKQYEQFYKSDYPGLTTWDTDGTNGYYWFYSSSNISKLSYRYELSDCYCFNDKGEIKNIVGSSWVKIKNHRAQIDMEM